MGFSGAPVSEGLSVLEKGLGVLEAAASLSSYARNPQLGRARRCCLPEGTPVSSRGKRVCSRGRAARRRVARGLGPRLLALAQS